MILLAYKDIWIYLINFVLVAWVSLKVIERVFKLKIEFFKWEDE